MVDPFKSIALDDLSSLKEYLFSGDINITNERNESLLHYAVLYNNSMALKMLLDYNINVNTKDRLGLTPLLLAIQFNNIGFVKILLRLNANVSLKDERGEDAFYKAFFYSRNMIIEILKEKYPINYNSVTKLGESYYFAATRSGNTEMFKYLGLDFPINEIKDIYNNSLLHVATKGTSLEMVSFLIKKGAYVNSMNNSLETPIFYAVKHENKELIKLLYNAGANLDLKTKFFETLDSLANNEILEYLVELRTKMVYKEYIKLYPLHYYIVLNDSNRISENMNLKNIDRKDPYGYKPLDISIYLSRINLIKEFKKSHYIK